MKIQNRKKFVTRILELIVLLATIILTILSINYANQIRTHKGYGGEYLVPILGLLLILIIETIYEESEEKKNNRRK